MPPTPLHDLDVDAHLDDPAIKQRFVTPMFDIIASRYDRFTRIFSFGMDRGWKEALLADAVAGAPSSGAVVLDLACGTGDLAFAAASRLSGARVTGIDASPAMIDEAKARRRAQAGGAAGTVAFRVGDMSRLDGVADASVDLVTAGYGFRNVPDFRAAVAECARVLEPGGRLLTLDFYRPESALWRVLFLGYLRVAGDLVGWLWHREPVVYGYIARSIDHFVSWREFSAAL
ncbi:MAG TPA: class I SAM-dependent methyltransferase, partial [Gemmatimonadaceae bacterium]|nr:class I SAM-dependent methyltransferase [Gemmatimonadaceae bacterium]